MWIWRQRARAHRRLQGAVALYYHPSYVLSELRAPQVSRDAVERGERTIAALASLGLLRPGEVRLSPPATVSELGRAHTLPYLESLSDPNVLGRIFGIQSDAMPIDPVLKTQRRAAGGTLAAARSVTTSSTRIAFNLGGGSHHAHADRGGGFCVYNDVAVAIHDLRANGFDAPIAIVDLDFHQGDGTESIFADDPSVLTCSIHGAAWQSITAVKSINIELPPGTADERYLQTLRKSLFKPIRDHRPGLIFYVAGNDVLEGDGLGDFALTLDGVLQRDRQIITWSTALGCKLVVSLGGGYSSSAHLATASFIRFALTDYCSAIEGPGRDLRDHYRRIARSLEPADLQRDPDPLEFTEADITGALIAPSSPKLILDYYTQHGIEVALERYGFLGELRAAGFESLRIDGDSSDLQKQRLRIFGKEASKENAEELLLVEIVVARRVLKAPKPLDTLHVLYVEWLLMQDPTRDFDNHRPKLPGQEHPGLGLSQRMLELLRRVCIRLDLDGIASKPANYHNALVASRDFCFLDPEAEGRFRAIRRTLTSMSVFDASRAIKEGRIIDSSGTDFVWQPALHMLPISKRLQNYFQSGDYEKSMEASYIEWRRRLELQAPQVTETKN